MTPTPLLEQNFKWSNPGDKSLVFVVQKMYVYVHFASAFAASSLEGEIPEVW